jgi:hypothetical protein
VSALTASIIRDDGAVVYINGVEVARSNMPTGPITRTTLASAAVDGVAETTANDAVIADFSMLVAGTNVVAVEVREAGGAHSGCLTRGGTKWESWPLQLVTCTCVLCYAW